MRLTITANPVTNETMPIESRAERQTWFRPGVIQAAANTSGALTWLPAGTFCYAVRKAPGMLRHRRHAVCLEMKRPFTPVSRQPACAVIHVSAP
ncbi:hypothetical protein R1flu_024198 [Riccia fluitans]|uniref:Uncharacterized protein n=1 Tax=Riccia fluitans TaxID=41844 RepID=A0ABD1XX83_9MARC